MIDGTRVEWDYIFFLFLLSAW